MLISVRDGSSGQCPVMRFRLCLLRHSSREYRRPGDYQSSCDDTSPPRSWPAPSRALPVPEGRHSSPRSCEDGSPSPVTGSRATSRSKRRESCTSISPGARNGRHPSMTAAPLPPTGQDRPAQRRWPPECQPCSLAISRLFIRRCRTGGRLRQVLQPTPPEWSRAASSSPVWTARQRGR